MTPAATRAAATLALLGTAPLWWPGGDSPGSHGVEVNWWVVGQAAEVELLSTFPRVGKTFPGRQEGSVCVCLWDSPPRALPSPAPVPTACFTLGTAC